MDILKDSEFFENGEVFEDGIQLKTQIDKGQFPSAYYGKKTQEALGTNWKIDHWSLNEGRAWWTKSDVVRDINMNRPNHPNYDPSTLFVPEDVWKGLSSSKI